MVYSIFTPHLLYRLILELLRRPSQFVGSDMVAYICVNIGVRGGGAH